MATTPDPLQAYADQLKAIAHPVRLRILRYLHEQPGRSVTEIYTALHLPQAITSQHLTTLKDRGVLMSEKAGTKIFYTVKVSWMGAQVDIVKGVARRV